MVDRFVDDFRQNLPLDDTEDVFVPNAIVGTCSEMCPTVEMSERDNLKLIHRLEAENDINDPHLDRQRYRKMDKTKMVKSYSRPAAGKDGTRSDSLRPYPVLLRTTSYLLNLLLDSRLDFTHVYDFLFDRLRAVRQDVIIQRLSVENTVTLLELMLPFYFYSCYRYHSSNAKIPTFDLGLHETQTKETLSRLHDAYCSQLENQSNVTSTLRNEYLSCILLYNCCDGNFNEDFYRLISNNSSLRQTWLCIFSLESGNFVRFFRLCRSLHVYAKLVLANKYVPKVRFRAFLTIAKAYNSRQTFVPLLILYNWLDFASLDDCRQCCSDMGLNIVEENVHFSAINSNNYSSQQELLTQPHWYRCSSLNDLDVSSIVQSR